MASTTTTKMMQPKEPQYPSFPRRQVRFASRPRLHMYYTEGSTTAKRKRKTVKISEETEGWIKNYSVLLSYQDPVREHLDAFVLLPDMDYLRGTETVIFKDFAKERADLRNRRISAVIDREVSLKLNNSTGNQQESSHACIEEELRKVSEEHSAVARAFALQMGRADERAAREGENVEMALRVVNSLHGRFIISETVRYIGRDCIVPGVCHFAHAAWRVGIICSGLM